MRRLIARQPIRLAKELVAKSVVADDIPESHQENSQRGNRGARGESHQVLTDISHHRKVLNMVKAVGGRGMMVGGSVRDAIIGKIPKGIDLEIYGLTPDQLQPTLSKEFDVDAVGKAFGVLKLKGVEVDISLPRRDSKISAGHMDFLVTPDKDMSFEEATPRRDLTINAVMPECYRAQMDDIFLTTLSRGWRKEVHRG